MEKTENAFMLELEPPYLIARFGSVHRTLGWSITRPGFGLAREVVWIEVRDADLPLHVDPLTFVKEKLASLDAVDAAVFLTAREIRRHHFALTTIDLISAACLTTVGLTNGEKVGSRQPSTRKAVGTINTLVHVSRPMSDAAFVEAISIATQARTAAIIETNALRKGPAITGTGTDCILVAAPTVGITEECSGLHTNLGEAIGRAVYEATLAGAREWSVENSV
jgi:adenosylcobinamide amidohydrolase